MTDQPTVWIHDSRYQLGYLRLHVEKPSGALGWNLEEVPLVGKVLQAHAYVVIVQYSTGNSFGTDTGLRTAALAATTPDLAAAARDAILENSKQVRPDYTITTGGVELHCGTWTGYFESVEHVTIELVEVVR